MSIRSIALSLAALAAVSTPTSGAFARGAPSLCFPLDTGANIDLPTESQNERLPAAAVVERVLAALGATGAADAAAPAVRPTVRMEALRRSFFAFERCGQDSATPEVRRLLGLLRDRVIAAEATEGDGATARRAAAWFDLGYAHAVFQHWYREGIDSGARYLAKAARLAAGDAELRLGAAVGSLGPSLPERIESLKHFQAAAAKLGTGDARFDGNLRRLLSSFFSDLDHSDPDQLRNQLGRRVAALEAEQEDARVR